MGFLKALTSIPSLLFGSTTNGKGVVGSISDVVNEWMPSQTSKNKQSIEDLKAGDASQAAAYGLVLKSHDSWFDILVDGLNRLPRPMLTLWVFGILANWWNAPDLTNVHPMLLNIVWTIITFWFGSRVVLKDMPSAIMAYREMKLTLGKKKVADREFKKAVDSVIEDNDYDN